MEKIVFLNPWALFFFSFLFSLFGAIMTLPAEAYPSNIEVMVLAYIGLVISLIAGFFWPLAVYKYLAGHKENAEIWDPKAFDKLAWIWLFFMPTAIVAKVSLEESRFFEKIRTALEIFEGVSVLLFFLSFIALYWSIAKMLKGGVGWCLVLFYWPLLASLVQGEIRELYPLPSPN